MKAKPLVPARNAPLRCLPDRAFCHALIIAACSLAAGMATAQSPTLEKLTEEQLGRLQKVALAQGSSIVVPPALVGALHFAPAQVGPVVRQVSFQLDDGIKHGFARLNDGTGYLLFRRTPQSVSAYHVDKEFKLVDAARNFSGDRFVALPANAAQDDVNGELVAWSRVLSPKGVSLPPPGPKPKSAMDAPPGTPAPPPTPGAKPAAPGK